MTPRRAHPDRRLRRGFTLIEMMMAVLLTMIVFAITVPFFRQQTMAVDISAGRLDALQNARYAQNAIDRELRMAGGVSGQPIIVQAAAYSLTFNVDLVSRVANDPNATYYTPTADSLSTIGWDPTRSEKLPTATKVYPTVMYYDANGNATPAETISYFALPDASSGRSDLYILYRRVNDRDSTIVTRNLWIPADTNYLFKYYKADNVGNITLIPQASLPIYWDAASHLTDSIATVQMRLSGLYRDVRRATDVTRTIYHNTTLMNYGKLKINSCGDPPAAPTNVVATQMYDSTGAFTKVRVTWTASADDGGGALDVGLYAVERKLWPSSTYFVQDNVPANASSSYAYDDFGTASGGMWYMYAVYAQDCSPANSAALASGWIYNP